MTLCSVFPVVVAVGGRGWEGREGVLGYRVVEQRYDAVMEVLGDGRTVTEVAEWRSGAVSCVGGIPVGGRGGCTTSWVGMVWGRCRRGRRSTGPWSAMG